MPGRVDEAVVSALATAVAALPGGGEGRTGQVEMAEAVAAAVADGRHLVVRAGTGTGKSLAYLVPIVDHELAQEYERRVVGFFNAALL